MGKIMLGKLADWNSAPGIMDIADSEFSLNFAQMSPQVCNLEYWIKQVPQGTLKDLIEGRLPDETTPAYMVVDGPLRDAMLMEMCFRSRTETLATRGLLQLAAIAPTIADMDFFVTQVMDECRHSYIFRNYVLKLGVHPDELDNTLDKYSLRYEKAILQPIEEWAMPIVNQEKYFYGGVAIITILLEGVLAPAAALSELKWLKIDPAAASMERGANIDEVRHLNVGANILKTYLEKNPKERNRLADVIHVGRELWSSLPVAEMVYEREKLFQEGMRQVEDKIKDYELIPGLLLCESTAETRMQLSLSWSTLMQNSRLTYMGLDEFTHR